MYTIPKDFDLKMLNGALVQQICFGINNIFILFENIGIVKIEGYFSLSFHDKEKRVYNVYPVSHDFGLLRLLEKKIVSIAANEARNSLIINFEEGMELTLIGDSNFESYSIKIGDKEFIV